MEAVWLPSAFDYLMFSFLFTFNATFCSRAKVWLMGTNSSTSIFVTETCQTPHDKLHSEMATVNGMCLCLCMLQLFWWGVVNPQKTTFLVSCSFSTIMNTLCSAEKLRTVPFEQMGAILVSKGWSNVSNHQHLNKTTLSKTNIYLTGNHQLTICFPVPRDVLLWWELCLRFDSSSLNALFTFYCLGIYLDWMTRQWGRGDAAI